MRPNTARMTVRSKKVWRKHSASSSSLRSETTTRSWASRGANVQKFVPKSTCYNDSVTSSRLFLCLRNRTAQKKEIIKAYRKLAQQWHPDNFQDPEEKKAAEKKFIDIAQAKEVLTNPGKNGIAKNDTINTLTVSR